MTLVAIIPFALVVIVLLVLIGSTLAARRRGYNIGGHVIVRCREGHLFTTLWVPGVSLKAIRLGGRRFQRCPVGRNWTMVRPVRDADLTEEERRLAAQYHDRPIP